MVASTTPAHDSGGDDGKENGELVVQLRAKKLISNDLAQVLHLVSIDMQHQQQPPQGGLRTLDLSGNFIGTIPADSPPLLFGFHVMKMDGNQFTNLMSFTPLTNLRTLDLSNNLIESTLGIGNNLHLQHLNLANNQIKHIEGLESLLFLETLDFSNNLLHKIADIRTLSFSTKLQELRLTGNKVTSCKGYRINILHLLPSIRVLDDKPFFVSHRSTLRPAPPASSSSKEEVQHHHHHHSHCNYSEIHAFKKASLSSSSSSSTSSSTRANSPISGQTPSSSSSKQQQHSCNETSPLSSSNGKPRYIPSWRKPPNPIPHGWKNYREIAQDSTRNTTKNGLSTSRRVERLVGEDYNKIAAAALGTITSDKKAVAPTAAAANITSPSKSPAAGAGREKHQTPPPPASSSLVVKDWSYKRCPMQNSISYQCLDEGGNNNRNNLTQEQQQQQTRRRSNDNNDERPEWVGPTDVMPRRRSPPRRRKVFKNCHQTAAAPPSVEQPVQKRSAAIAHENETIVSELSDEDVGGGVTRRRHTSPSLSSISMDLQHLPPPPHPQPADRFLLSESSINSSIDDDSSVEMREIISMLRRLLLAKRQSIQELASNG